MFLQSRGHIPEQISFLSIIFLIACSLFELFCFCITVPGRCSSSTFFFLIHIPAVPLVLRVGRVSSNSKREGWQGRGHSCQCSGITPGSVQKPIGCQGFNQRSSLCKAGTLTLYHLSSPLIKESSKSLGSVHLGEFWKLSPSQQPHIGQCEVFEK